MSCVGVYMQRREIGAIPARLCSIAAKHIFFDKPNILHDSDVEFAVDTQWLPTRSSSNYVMTTHAVISAMKQFAYFRMQVVHTLRFAKPMRFCYTVALLIFFHMLNFLSLSEDTHANLHRMASCLEHLNRHATTETGIPRMKQVGLFSRARRVFVGVGKIKSLQYSAIQSHRIYAFKGLLLRIILVMHLPVHTVPDSWEHPYLPGDHTDRYSR